SARLTAASTPSWTRSPGPSSRSRRCRSETVSTTAGRRQDPEGRCSTLRGLERFSRQLEDREGEGGDAPADRSLAVGGELGAVRTRSEFPGFLCLRELPRPDGSESQLDRMFNVFNNQIAVLQDEGWTTSPPAGFPATINEPNQEQNNPNYGKILARSAPRSLPAALKVSF